MNPEKWKENIETVNLMRVKTNLPIQKEKSEAFEPQKGRG